MTFEGQIEVIGYLVGCISWIVHVIIWICVNNEQIWLLGNYGSDFEQYFIRLQLDPISLLVNFSHELAQIMTTYDFLSAKQVILSNVRTDFNLTQILFWSTFEKISTYNDHIWLGLNKRFWTMFEPISAWYMYIFTFGHLFTWIGTYNDFLSAKQAILSNVRTDFNWTQFRFWPHLNS